MGYIINPIPQGSSNTLLQATLQQGFLHWSSSNMVISKILGPRGEDSELNHLDRN